MKRTRCRQNTTGRRTVNRWVDGRVATIGDDDADDDDGTDAGQWNGNNGD